MSQSEVERRQEEAEAHIRATIINELCQVMQKTNLPPMAVLRLATRAIGTIYREMAEAHSGVHPCPCGWRPHYTNDVEVLGMALMTACESHRRDDLRRMRIAGTA
ncbi:hypothetical protein ACFPLB_01935 [Aquamicrobium segne]|uniref:Uncharacterized protein n=1 Tax=Aquamicrobium segne TaxID=469547 RepID=A0ABW0GTQ0_9HYPH